MNPSRGFSLLELLVVLAILGIVLSLGSGFMRADRFAVNQTATVFAAQINRMRLEAIKHNATAGLSIAGNTGYTLWVDANANSLYDSGTDLTLLSYTFGQGDLARVQLDVGNSSTSNFPVLFDARGIPIGAINGRVVLSNLGNSYSKVICISSQGRTRILEGTTCS